MFSLFRSIRPFSTHTSARSMSSVPLLLSPHSLSSLLSSPTPSLRPIILDASWYMPSSPPGLAWSEYKSKRIPGAGFWDLDVIAGEDKTGLGLKHMVPTKERFAESCSRLGIGRESHVVIYDSKGVFSAPRAVWTFKAFGHPRVSLLSGGLPSWISHSLPLSTSPPIPPNPHSFPTPATTPTTAAYEPFPPSPLDASQYHETAYQPIMSVLLYDTKPKVESYFIADIEEMETDYPVSERVAVVRGYEEMCSLSSLSSQDEGEIILDARPNARFTGANPEPRPNLPSGHIPNSFSLPFTSLLTTSSSSSPTTFLSPPSLSQTFSRTLGPSKWAQVLSGERGITVTCGSGMTAAVIWLGLELVREGGDGGGSRETGLYDESWMGWAAREGSRIERD